MNQKRMEQTEAADDGRLPGGAMHDPSPLDRGDGAWLWTTGGAPLNDSEPLRIDGASCEWHESGPTRAGRGWYVLAMLPGEGGRVRIGPYPTTFGLADALRDLFPARLGGRDDVDYLESRVSRLVELASDDRIVEAAGMLSAPEHAGIGAMNPAELIAAVREACADREAWEKRRQ